MFLEILFFDEMFLEILFFDEMFLEIQLALQKIISHFSSNKKSR